MSHGLYLTSSEKLVDMSVARFELIKCAQKKFKSLAFFKPIICDPCQSCKLQLEELFSQYGLKQASEDTYVYSLSEAKQLIHAGKREQLLNAILEKYNLLIQSYEFVFVEGISFTENDLLFSFDLETEIINALGLAACLVVGAQGASHAEVLDGVASSFELFSKKNIDIATCFILKEQKGKGECTALEALLKDSQLSKGQGTKATFILLNKAAPLETIHSEKERSGDALQACEKSKTALLDVVENSAFHKLSPKMFELGLQTKAASRPTTIVLPEGEDERILRAAQIVEEKNIAKLVLLGDAALIEQKIKDLQLQYSPHILSPKTYNDFDTYVDTYYSLRSAKGISREDARAKMEDLSYFGTMMVHTGFADGMVSGALNTTAHTLRPAFEFIKMKTGFSLVSSVFFMCLQDSVLVFGDCAVNPNPSAAQLADIAISSAQTAEAFGLDARVAMLSYATGSSGKGVDVDFVIEATELAKAKAPHLAIEGPIQYDAAIDPVVAKTKLPASAVAGKATVFVFPDLNSGNIAYKAVQRAAKALAIGPVLQGLNKPINDLSRGCSVDDIVNTVAITAIQAQKQY